MAELTNEIVKKFLEGHDPMERIVAIECAFNEDRASIIYVNEQGEKRVRKEDFKPFLWCKNSAAIRLFGGNKGTLKRKMREYGIWVKELKTTDDKGNTHERLESGYKYMFYATRRMSNSQFQAFFTEGGVPVHPRQKKGEPEQKTTEYITVPAIEQFMIQTGKRLFKGWDSYDNTTRLIFDLETQGLNPRIHAIEQIGIHTNKGFERILTIAGNNEEERRKCELAAIVTFISLIAELKPDIIAGHNSENFDWDFIIERCKVLGTSLEEISLNYFSHPIFKQKKEKVLKLGGEVEYYKPTIMWGHSMIDSLHAARRAQAIDSSMKSSNLKYVTKYLNLNKPNRVYVPGNKITETWNVTNDEYAFNNDDGKWYHIDETHPLQEGYELTSGRYIVERYLLDDLWETDKIELTLNEANFQVAKLLPTTFSRACTMGTAGIWKLIMFAWSYEHDLAIPALGKDSRFVGGLSRLLITGHVDRIVKLDYNSLYPSVILSFWVLNEVDPSGVLNNLLNYILGQRENYKTLKAQAGDKVDELKESLKEKKSDKEKEEIKEQIAYWKAEKSSNDKKQLPLKILCNSYFGSAGNPGIFPWGNIVAAEKTTCISRQMLRLMISHFKKIGYEPVVGDSVTPDTPLFIKYNESGYIDIKPIGEIINEHRVEVDALGREYDYSEKPFKVLCRSGWVSPKYIYRHKTDKPLYDVSEGNMSITVTEDHSLFNDEQKKIKPSQINDETKLEYYSEDVISDREFKWLNETRAKRLARWLKDGMLDRVPEPILNTKNNDYIKLFLEELGDFDENKGSKTLQAGMQFIKNKIKQ